MWVDQVTGSVGRPGDRKRGSVERSSMTTRPALPGEDGTPGLQLQLVDSDDEPLHDGAGGERRPSTASLSR